MFNKSILALIITMFCYSAFSATGFLKGERTSGLNKICYYNGPSGDFSETVSSYNVCPTTADDGKKSSSTSYGASQIKTQTNKATGFLSGERVSGLNKTCYYDSPRGTFTKTVGAYNVCKQSAKHSF